MKTDGSKNIGCKNKKDWVSSAGGNTPPQSKITLLPKNRNHSFVKRFIKWWTE